MTTYPFAELVALARAETPFYRQLYAHLPADPALADLPVIEPVEYWKAHERNPREILTRAQVGGFVLNSGGTTGAPKFSYLTEDEWDSACEFSARSFEAAGLQEGDRIANLFVPGNLYSSFLFATYSLRATRLHVIQYPIGYFTPMPDIAKYVRNLKINVLLGVPTHLSNLVDLFLKEKVDDVHIDRILFAGEPCRDAQRDYFRTHLPGVRISSAGYASVDAGVIGFADADCGPGEHRVFDGATIMEILDEETGAPIEHAGEPGVVIFTSLMRRLMPVIRYPAGDRAQWIEPPGSPDRKFALLDRSGETARVASVSVPVAEVRTLLEPFRDELGLDQFQLLVTREGLRDQLTLRLVGTAPREVLEARSEEILDLFNKDKPLLGRMAATGAADPARIEWIRSDQLIVSERTGKLRMVVDKRGL